MIDRENFDFDGAPLSARLARDVGVLCLVLFFCVGVASIVSEQSLSGSVDGVGPDSGANDGLQSVVLVEAMRTGRALPGYSIVFPVAEKRWIGGLRVEVVRLHQGSRLIGLEMQVKNVGLKPVMLDAAWVAPAGAMRIEFEESVLGAGASAPAWVVLAKGTD